MTLADIIANYKANYKTNPAYLQAVGAGQPTLGIDPTVDSRGGFRRFLGAPNEASAINAAVMQQTIAQQQGLQNAKTLQVSGSDLRIAEMQKELELAKLRRIFESGMPQGVVFANEEDQKTFASQASPQTQQLYKSGLGLQQRNTDLDMSLSLDRDLPDKKRAARDATLAAQGIQNEVNSRVNQPLIMTGGPNGQLPIENWKAVSPPGTITTSTQVPKIVVDPNNPERTMQIGTEIMRNDIQTPAVVTGVDNLPKLPVPGTPEFDAMIAQLQADKAAAAAGTTKKAGTPLVDTTPKDAPVVQGAAGSNAIKNARLLRMWKELQQQN